MSKSEIDRPEGGVDASAAPPSGNLKAHRFLFAAVELNNEPNDESCCVFKPLNSLFGSSDDQRLDSIFPGVSLKRQQSMLLETIQNFNKGHARRFFQGLKVIVHGIIEAELYVPESAFQDDNIDGEGDDDIIPNTDIIPDEKSTEHLHFLKHASNCVEAYLQGQESRLRKKRTSFSRPPSLPIVSEVYGVALDLHNILFSLQSCGPEGLVTQSAIIKLCESWWHANATQRDNLIVQCLPLLVLQTLDGKNFQKSHIKRLLNLKEALQIIDFNNPSSDSLRSLLLRVASNPLCLRMSEGRNFLAALFQETSLVSDLHLAIRAQIPEAKGTVLHAYGEIYLKAWKDSANSVDDESRESIEHEALQDLVHAVIHVSSNTTAKSILILLEPIHSKRTPEIEGLLYRLYSPILWRSLGATSAQVRVNAIRALGQVFPLQDASHTQTKAAIAKSTLALKSALQDPDPRVRVAGSEATAKVCAVFWDVLAATDIRMLLNHIVMEHASDAAASAVRAGALESITSLLESPQSRAILRPLLPSLGNLIHDKAERVRVAAVRMLLAIKRIPGIRFYHVVPVDQLTARLSEEGRIHRSLCNAVSKELTSLLLNSYFPQGPDISGADQMKRTLTFLLTEPSASTVFYANLSCHLPVDSVVKLIAMLLNCLDSAVKSDQARQIRVTKMSKKRRRQAPQVQENEEFQTLSASNTPLMARIAETIYILWESIESDLTLADHKDSNELLLQRISQVDLTNVLIHFEQKTSDIAEQHEQSTTRYDCVNTCGAILRCLGKLPLGAVEGILPHITSRLSSISASEGVPAGRSQRQVSAYFAVLCSWGKTEEVVNALSISIASGNDIADGLASPLLFDENKSGNRQTKAAQNKRGPALLVRNGSQQTLTVPSVSPAVAWGIIQDLLQGDDACNLEIRNAILASGEASKAFEDALERGTVVAEQLLLADSGLGKSIQGSEVEFALFACEAYGRFALHKAAHHNPVIEFSDQAKLLLQWTTEKVAPSFRMAKSGETELRKLDLSCILNTSDSMIIPGSSSPMSPPRRKANLRRTPNRICSVSLLDEEAILDEPAVFVVRGIASSLLQTSCTIFSDWICVGGNGTDEIAQSAVTWCQVFEDEDENISDLSQTELVPSFARLAVSLCLHADNFDLMKQLLINCNQNIIGDDVIGKAVTMMLSERNALRREKLLSGIVEAVLAVAYRMCQGQSTGTPDDFPSSVDALFARKSGSVGPALSALMSNPQACVEIVDRLLSALDSDNREEDIVNFQVKLLFLLVNSGENAAIFANKIREIDFEHFESATSGRNIMERLREIVA